VTAPYAQPADEVASQFGVDPRVGLSSDDVAARRAQYGANVVVRDAGRPAWRLFVAQFGSIVVALLGAAAAVEYFTGDRWQAAAIAIVLLINALTGFAIEWQSQRALRRLSLQTKTNARVRRDGRDSIVDAIDLVPGDVIELEAGVHVPADARVIDAAALTVDEAALTGESLPVAKLPAAVDADTALADRTPMVYLGTQVVAGRGEAIVTATADASELGRIGRLLRAVELEPTPLERKLAHLGRQLVVIVIVVGAVVALAGIVRGMPVWEMVEVGITLAVAAVPEGLPAVTTLILAVGVLRMARRHALVRKLTAVETLGGTTVICTDKTGTLTMNRLAVRRIDAADERPLLRIAVLCNDATPAGIGDPTEVALVAAARERGIDVAAMRADSPRSGEVPFDSSTRTMITMHGRYAAMKGAPAEVLDACALPAEEKSRLLARNEELASEGLRVLAFADRDGADGAFIFRGFAALADPPRPGAAEAIAEARKAGVRVVMLTGDQVATARAIALELRISGDREPVVVHARELARLDADAFARVTPDEKLRVVSALRDAGEVVAVTGDGVNDAPALRRADIGIAMGSIGTDVAKETADLILTDDNLGTIVHAIEEGRTIFANITKFVHLMFSHNLGEVIVIFVAILSGMPLPLLPLQILWVNVATDIFPAFALALEPPLAQRMRDRPQPAATLLSASFLGLIAWQAAMLATIVLAGYQWALRSYGSGAHARTIALCAMVAVEVGHMFNCRSRTRSALEGITKNPYLWAAATIVVALQIIAVTFSPLMRILKVTHVTTTDAAVIIGCGLLPIVVVELQKRLTKRG